MVALDASKSMLARDVSPDRLDRAKLAFAKPGALVMHPGPMNRGVEIASDIADDMDVSLIQEQVEMGVAIRMAVLDALSRGLS